MYVKLSYAKEFDDLYMHLKSKYPDELWDLDGIGKQLDMNDFAKKFYADTTEVAADVSIDSNANVCGTDVITYNFEMPKPFHKLNSYYLLWKHLRDMEGLQAANDYVEMAFQGHYYINDGWDIGRPYCFNFSTYDIALQGLPMGDRVKPVAPKSLYSFVRQVEQFVVYAANSTLGATGLADLLIVLSWYVDRIAEPHGVEWDEFGEPHYNFYTDDDAWGYVKEVLASFIYTLNWQFRGNQSPFTNVSLYDQAFLKELVPEYLIDGKAPKLDTVWVVQELFMEVMNEELRRAPLTFPVTTACFATDAGGNLKDENFAELVAEQNKEFGFINIYCGDTSTLSSCCRLRSDTSLEYFNNFGAGSTKIGSLGVVTLNLPRCAYAVSKLTEKGSDMAKAMFLGSVEGGVEAAAAINHAKRMEIMDRVDRGNLPLYTLGHMDLKKQYSTCGLTGINEALEILGMDILSGEGQEFVLDILEEVNSTNAQMTVKYAYPHNCEQVPAENSSIKLAKKDALMGYDHGYDFFSNQFIPLTTQADMLDRIELQGKFDKHFSGGAICHLNVAEKIEDTQQIVDLIKHCAKKGVVYWAINYTLKRCEKGHMSVGRDISSCTTCGGEITDEFTRVVGFLTNTANWHEVRREQDWPERKFY